MNYLLGSTAAFLCDYAAKEKVEKTYDEKKQKNSFVEKFRLKNITIKGQHSMPWKKDRNL